jgi:hypothetical protein
MGVIDSSSLKDAKHRVLVPVGFVSSVDGSQARTE